MFASFIEQAKARLGQYEQLASSSQNNGESESAPLSAYKRNGEDASILPATSVPALQERRNRGNSLADDPESRQAAEHDASAASSSSGGAIQGPAVHAHTFLRGYDGPRLEPHQIGVVSGDGSAGGISASSASARVFTGIHTSASNAILSVGGFTDDSSSSSSSGGSAKVKDSDFNLNKLAHEFNQKQYLPFVLGAPFWACFFYSLVSTSMVLVNKLILSSYHFKYPMVLLFHQNLMTVNSLYIAKEMGITTYEGLESKKVMRWLPLDVLFVLMLLTGFYSVELLSVPMITIFKNTNNIFIAVGDALVFGNFPSQGVVWTMLLMLLAAVLASVNDLEYSFEGYMWTLGNCLASTMFVLYAQTAIAKTNLSTFGKVYYNNVLALPLVLVADLFVFHDFEKLFLRSSKEDFMRFFTMDFIFLWFLSGVLGFFQSLSSLKAQHLTSPTTYSMVGSLNKIPLTFLGVYIFHSPINAKGVLYVSMSIAAGGLYSYTKAKEDIALRQAQQLAKSGAPAPSHPQQQPQASESFTSPALVHQRHKARSMPAAQVDEKELLLAGASTTSKA